MLQVAHLAEHRRAVNQVAVAGNGAFFASASSDETVKVWDCRRLEKDVSFRSRLTYASQVGSESGKEGDIATILNIWKIEHGKPDLSSRYLQKLQVD